jgi:hypothetical protein
VVRLLLRGLKRETSQGGDENPGSKVIKNKDVELETGEK